VARRIGLLAAKLVAAELSEAQMSQMAGTERLDLRHAWHRSFPHAEYSPARQCPTYLFPSLAEQGYLAYYMAQRGYRADRPPSRWRAIGDSVMRILSIDLE
jgi:hypothetical protein